MNADKRKNKTFLSALICVYLRLTYLHGASHIFRSTGLPLHLAASGGRRCAAGFGGGFARVRGESGGDASVDVGDVWEAACHCFHAGAQPVFPFAGEAGRRLRMGGGSEWPIGGAAA